MVSIIETIMGIKNLNYKILGYQIDSIFCVESWYIKGNIHRFYISGPYVRLYSVTDWSKMTLGTPFNV